MNTITAKLISRTTANKIQQAIQQCDRFITLESKRSNELRPASVQQYLDFCVSHRARLVHMLELGVA